LLVTFQLGEKVFYLFSKYYTIKHSDYYNEIKTKMADYTVFIHERDLEVMIVCELIFNSHALSRKIYSMDIAHPIIYKSELLTVTLFMISSHLLCCHSVLFKIVLQFSS